MPLTKFSEFSAPDADRDDDTPLSAPDKVDPGMALARAALASAVPAAQRLIFAAPRLVVISVPSAAWATAIAEAIAHDFPDCYVRALVEAKKGSQRFGGDDLASAFRRGAPAVAVSQDPAACIPPPLLGAADMTITVPKVTSQVVRQAVREALGRHARGLVDEDISGLDYEEIATALRPGSTGGEVVRRLRRARASKATPIATARLPRLEELPLTASVRAWSSQLIQDLRLVEAGELDASAVPSVVLEGPPGTGKTLIASGLAGSLGWRFVSTSVGGWFTGSDGHLGGVAKACAAFFDEVMASDRSIGFLDEIDALPNRFNLAPKDAEWWTTLITATLLQIDRVKKSGRPLLLIAATNLYDRLDPALVRPGRLQQRVSVLPPQGEAELGAVFSHYLRGDLGADTIHVAVRLAAGATPATIEAWVAGARARARAEDRRLSPADLLATIAPPDGRSPSELRVAALHEAGHVVVALRLGIRVMEVSIVASDGAGGYTRTEQSAALPTRVSIEDTVATILGGRAADVVLGGGAHAGARSDLALATRLLAEAMAADGLYGTLVDTSLGDGSAAVRLSPRLAGAVDLELKRLLARAVAIVETEAHLVRRLAEELLLHRILVGDEIERALRNEAPSPGGGKARQPLTTAVEPNLARPTVNAAVPDPEAQ